MERKGKLSSVKDVLEELHSQRALEVLTLIASFGIIETTQLGFSGEILALREMGYLNSGQVYAANFDYLINNIWIN